MLAKEHPLLNEPYLWSVMKSSPYILSKVLIPENLQNNMRTWQDRSPPVASDLKTPGLNLSFRRSTKDVLHAVDLVFQQQLNAKGLTQSGELDPHDAIRSAEPGEVQVWPLLGKSGPSKSESWIDPIDHLGSEDPAVRLAERIASTVKEWVGKPLPGAAKTLR